MSPWSLAFSSISRSNGAARLSILIFHRVLPKPDPLFPEIPDAARFEEMVRWVAAWFRVLPLSEAAERLYSASLPARALAITFDDGYADNAEVAAPILRRHGLPATFFVASGMLDGGRMWNDTVIESVRGCGNDLLDLGSTGLGCFGLKEEGQRRVAIDTILAAIKRLPYEERAAQVHRIAETSAARLPADLMMRSGQLRDLTALGMEIGAHTVTHPILRQLDDDRALREIAEGRDALEQIVGTPISLFAYPNGVPGIDYDARHVEMVRRCGFRAAVSTVWGVSDRGTDRFQLARFTPWDRSRFRFGLRMARNYLHNPAVHP